MAAVTINDRSITFDELRKKWEKGVGKPGNSANEENVSLAGLDEQEDHSDEQKSDQEIEDDDELDILTRWIELFEDSGDTEQTEFKTEEDISEEDISEELDDKELDDEEENLRNLVLRLEEARKNHPKDPFGDCFSEHQAVLYFLVNQPKKTPEELSKFFAGIREKGEGFLYLQKNLQKHKLIYYITGKEPLKKEEIAAILTKHNEQADEDNRFSHSSIDFTAWFIAGASEEEKNVILEKLNTELGEFTRYMTEIKSSPRYSAVFELEKALESVLRSCAGVNEAMVKLMEVGGETIRKRIKKLKDGTENSEIEKQKKAILYDIGGLEKTPKMRIFSCVGVASKKGGKILRTRPRAVTASVKQRKSLLPKSNSIKSQSF